MGEKIIRTKGWKRERKVVKGEEWRKDKSKKNLKKGEKEKIIMKGTMRRKWRV